MIKYEYFDDKGKHLHTGDGRPMLGTTTVINEIYPPPLAWWAAGKALEKLGWIDPKKFSKEELLIAAGDGRNIMLLLANLEMDEYLKALDDMYREHDKAKRKGGVKGKDKHALIEKYIKTQMGTWNYQDDSEHPDDHYFDDIKGFVTWAEKNVKRFLWSEAHCYSIPLWAGGICDFGCELNIGLNLIGDAKSGMYHKHYIQEGGYSRQIKDGGGLYDRSGNKIMEAPRIDGFMIWDYNKDEAHYLIGQDWVEKLESDFAHTVEMYNRRDVIGVTELPIIKS